ncbi:MAG: cobalamin-dependent protein [Planctomycetota bacterium]
MAFTKEPPTDLDRASDLLSVGKVARETGISPDTLRIWERRYGAPVPLRLPSGHRRYSIGQARWLRMVAEALARGMRPSKVLPLDPEVLERDLLPDARIALDPEVQALVRLLRDFDMDEMTHRLLLRAADVKPIDFLERSVSPLLVHVGAEWAAGRLEVRHEHVCSQVVTTALQRLRAKAKPTDLRGRSLTLLVSTLPEDLHELGLHMIAFLAESYGVNVKLLGADVPLSEIVATALESKASAVGISVSMSRGGIEADQLLMQLADALPADVELVAGGAGTRSGRRAPRGVRLLSDLGDFRRWVEGWIARTPRKVS